MRDRLHSHPTSPSRPAGRLGRRELLGAALGTAAVGGTLGACRSVPREHDDEPFLGLEDQSGDHAPISAREKATRIGRLAGILRDTGVDALLIEAGATLRYLSDVRWGSSERLFALVVLSDGTCFWISPAFEAPRARERIEAHGPRGRIITWDEHEYAWQPLAAALAERGVTRIAIDPRARAFVAQSLMRALGPEQVLGGQDIVRRLRGPKSAAELGLMRAANELTQQAIVAVSERLEVGMLDYEIGALLRRAQESLGLKGVWVLPLIGDGAAFPHGSPEGRALQQGDLILVDTGGGLHGYQSDISRTWFFGNQGSGEALAGWHDVREAQRRAFQAIRPGVRCSEVDGAARSYLEEAGWGAGYEAFAHRLGHGIGLEGHEEPYFDGGSQVRLEPGMTFSNEPGLYLAGRFGIRLEDIVVVTEDGADHFGAWQRDPSSPAG